MKSIRLPVALAAITASAVLPLGAFAQDYSGAISEQTYISEGAPLWGKIVSKTLTLEPGKHTFSVDSLGMTDRVVLTLLNPTDRPMAFETAKVLGSERMTLVPANSSRVVSYVFKKPISDEVEYFVMSDPAWARTAMTTPAPTTAVITPAPTSTVVVSPAPVPAAAPVVETRQAVRGYW